MFQNLKFFREQCRGGVSPQRMTALKLSRSALSTRATVSSAWSSVRVWSSERMVSEKATDFMPAVIWLPVYTSKSVTPLRYCPPFARMQSSSSPTGMDALQTTAISRVTEGKRGRGL